MDPWNTHNCLVWSSVSYDWVMAMVPPERGFSINKILLDAHGTNLKDDTIVAIRLGMFM